jgi:hypothetical protein
MAEHQVKDWIGLLYSPYWTRIFNRLARERYGRFTDGAELAGDARQKLAMRLSRLVETEGVRPLTDSYVLVSFKHALVDVFRERHGRPEPRQWLRAFGPLGKRLYELYCLLGLRLDEILDALSSDPELADSTTAQPEQVRYLLREMDRQQECVNRAAETPLNPDGGDADEAQPRVDPPDPADGPDASLASRQAEVLRALLFSGRGDDAPPLAEPLVRRLAAILRRAGGEGMSLDDEEAFVLRGFLGGLTEQRVGELLGGLTVRQVRYRRQTAIDKLGRLLRRAGIGLDELMI